MPKVRKPLLNEFHKQFYAIALEHARCVNLRFEHQSLGVHTQVALCSLDLLARIVAALFAANAGGLDALGVDVAGRRLGVPPEAYPRPPEQSLMEALPSAVDAPSSTP